MFRKLLLGAGSAAMLTGCFELPAPPDGGSGDCTSCGVTATVDTSGTTAPSGPVGGTGGSGTGADTGGAGTDTGGTDTGAGTGGTGAGTTGADTGDTKPPARSAPPTKQEASRFLVQASFGPTTSDIADVEREGYAGWLASQMQLPAPVLIDRIRQTPDAKRHTISDLFWSHAVEGEDQLRQRVAYALSQIVVVSAHSELYWNHPDVFVGYMDILQRHALGNYQDLIREVSLSPAMGNYLSSLGNRKADGETGAAPDENFAREIMQLFTIGLEELNPDGTPKGRETYTIEDIKGLAAVFTGLSWQDAPFGANEVTPTNATASMVSYDGHHEAAPKTFLGATIDVGANAEASVEAALDHLLAHPNLAPFVGKQVIQRLVTSNPSPAYVARVSAAFEAGTFEADGLRFGAGRRGDMAATVAAVLLDEEARSEEAAAKASHGKVREPAMRFAQFARAFSDGAGLPTSGAAPDTGTLRFAHQSWVLWQQPYAPSSVFGFTRPGYVAPGTWSAEAGMVSPQLSLAGGARTASYINFMANAVRGHDRMAAFAPDYAAFMPLVTEPERLVDTLDDLLTYGSLEDTTRARIVKAVSAVRIDDRDTEKDKQNRMHLAVLMMVTSPEYGVLR